MIINITSKTIIGDIQRKLSVAFPFLRVEFIRKAHHGEKNHKHQWYEGDEKVFEVLKHSKPGWVTIQSWRKCGYVKEVFEKDLDCVPSFSGERMMSGLKLQALRILP